MRIEGFLAQKKLLHKIRNKSVKLYVPACVLFERDFEEIALVRSQGFLAYPLITVDELDMLIPRRIRVLRLLLENKVNEICVASQSLKRLAEHGEALELLSNTFNIVAILMTDQADLEELRALSRVVRLYLPLSKTTLNILSRCEELGVVISTRLFVRRGRSCERISPVLIHRYIQMLKRVKPDCRVIVDILGIDSHTTSL